MKPCPFCGSDAVGLGYSTHPDGHEIVMIACANCGANGPVRPYRNGFIDDDEAAALWMHRAGERNAFVPDAKRGSPTNTTAPDILRTGLQVLDQRGIQRDQPTGERSMPAVVRAFAELTGHQLSEQQGWLFMALVKIRRSQSGRPDVDHYVDGANYIALAGEAALNEPVFVLTPAGEVCASGVHHNVHDVDDDHCPSCAGRGQWDEDDGSRRYCRTCSGTGRS